MHEEDILMPMSDVYTTVPVKIFSDTRKKPNDLNVWVSLCSFAHWKAEKDDEGTIKAINGYCCPTLQELAKRARCTVPTAKKGVRHLEALGYVTMRERRGETGKRLSNEYVLKG